MGGGGGGEVGRRAYAIKKANKTFVYTFVPEYAQSILGFVNLFIRTRSDFEKHLTIKNCDKIFLKIILRLKSEC